RDPKSFRDSEKFIAAVQACHAQKHSLLATPFGLERLNFALCDLPHIEASRMSPISRHLINAANSPRASSCKLRYVGLRWQEAGRVPPPTAGWCPGAKEPGAPKAMWQPHALNLTLCRASLSRHSSAPI